MNSLYDTELLIKPDAAILKLIQNGWTQHQIAVEVGTTQSIISRLLRGDCKAPRYILVDRLRHLVQQLNDFSNLKNEKT